MAIDAYLQIDVIKGESADAGWHVGLFERSLRGARMVNGLPCEFSKVDQYDGKHAGRRGVAILTPEWKKAHPAFATPANDAAEYYVVVP